VCRERFELPKDVVSGGPLKLDLLLLTLLGAVLKSSPVRFDISAAIFASNPFFVLRP
jgi:hypothetical protein